MNESWSVIDSKTGRKICECGEEKDAIMMVSIHSHRIYKKNRYILDQIIDVKSETDKQLPGQIGLPESPVQVLDTYKEKLPEGNQEPFIV